MVNQSVDFLSKVDLLSNTEVPKEVMDRAKQSLLDYLAVTSAGAVFQGKKLDNYLGFIQPEPGNSSAIGMDKNLTLKEAVFLNGLNGHALDFDDGTNSGIIHLGSPIFSVLLPLAQKFDLTVNDVLKAAVIGYETSYTMAVSIQPGHKALGFHATGTCGMLGATIAATYLLDFSSEERFAAFGVACIAASGMLKVLDDESELKPYNVAKTSLLVLTAISMAKAGFKGHHDPLGGRGFFKMMTGKETVEIKPLLLNGTYAIMKTYTKPYASCRYTHPAVEAAISLREKVCYRDVKRINIRTYSLAVTGHDHTNIPSSYSAKMSIPYAAAVGLIYGKAGLAEFSEQMVKDPVVLSLVNKIFVNSDEELSSLFPKTQTALMEIIMEDGRTETCRVDFPKGEPENPLSDLEFKERYTELMKYGKQKHFAEVYELVLNHNEPLKKIMALL